MKTLEFIKKANKIHNNRYNYSEVNYINSKTNVKIICSIHGEFFQTPNNHLKPQNCPSCVLQNRKDVFIQKATEKHNKYDYSEVNYINSKTNVTIICPEHGEFQQTPEAHLKSMGCKKCSSRKSNTNEFIQKANKIHNKYDYSEVNYIDANTKVKIICPEHGSFFQTPGSHLNGSCCSKCSNEQKSSLNYIKKYTLNPDLGNKLGIFYKLKFIHKKLGFEFIKIGITSKSIKQRYNYKYNEYKYIILEEHKVTNLESALMERDFIMTTKLEKFKFPDNVKKFSGYTECYKVE